MYVVDLTAISNGVKFFHMIETFRIFLHKNLLDIIFKNSLCLARENNILNNI